jgi:hypothetical protein
MSRGFLLLVDLCFFLISVISSVELLYRSAPATQQVVKPEDPLVASFIRQMALLVLLVPLAAVNYYVFYSK